MVRHVASPEGEKRFGLPLHAPILPKPPTARVSQFFTAQTDSLNFYQAIAALNSPQHRSFATASLSINDKYGAKTVSTRDMVGDTAQYGTEDSVMQNLRIDAETSRYIAAEKGLAGNQLSVLNFVHSKSGPDAMVTVAMPESMSLKDLRAILDERGLEFRSIDPKTNELVFFSGGGDKLAEIGQLAKDYANGKIRISRGTGEFVGSDESREDAANVYRSILARPRFGSSGRDGRRFGDPNHGISETSIDKLIAASSSSSREGRTMGSLENLIVALSGQKHVRTPEGAQKYGQPIGSLIQLHLEAISHANSLHDASGVNTHTPHAGMPSEFGPAHAAASTMHPPAPPAPHQAPSKPGVSKPLAKGGPASPEFGPAQTKATLGAPKPSSAHQAPSGSSEFGPAHAKATMHAPAPANAHQAPSKPSGSKPLASGAASPEFGAAQTKATLGALKPSSAHQAPSATPKVDKLASKVGKAAPGAPKAGATKGTGSKADPIVTSDVVEAAKALGEGKFVTLNSRHEVSTLIDKLAEIVDDAKKKGENAPTYDLCKVSVPGTNLFCAESKGIPRTMMPQLKGIPLPGTPADKMQKNDKGEVDLGPEFVKWLKENKGIDVVDANIDASHLKASQNQLNGAKVAGMSQAMLAGKVPESPIFVTQDDYIVDGHHRWAANVANEIKTNKAINMPTYQIKSDIIHVLAYANHFTKHNGIPQAGVGAPAPTGAGPKTDLQAKKAGMAGTATEQLAAKAGKKK